MIPKNKKHLKLIIYLVLHNIRSAYNVCSIFRTADGAGVSKIFLCGYTPTPRLNKSATRPPLDPRLFAARRSFLVGALARLESPREFSSGRVADLLESDKVAKTALGAEKYVPWEQCRQTWRLLAKLKKDGVSIVALEQSEKSVDFYKFKPEFPLVLVLGNEVGGLSQEILKYVDKIIEIPMRGKKESLNVSVAAGVALYEITKQKP